MELFEEEKIDSGAVFSLCRKYRYVLWRKWDKSKPLVMFIGLNPSTAAENQNDATIRRVITISKNLGYGGVYMMNCFPLVSTYPDDLLKFENTPFHEVEDVKNQEWLSNISKKCKDVIFAWGNFKIVSDYGRDKALQTKFPNAQALHINKNGSPKHPLYCKSDIKPVLYNLNSVFIPATEKTPCNNCQGCGCTTCGGSGYWA